MGPKLAYQSKSHTLDPSQLEPRCHSYPLPFHSFSAISFFLFSHSPSSHRLPPLLTFLLFALLLFVLFLLILRRSFLLVAMPNKYSHALVLSQDRYRGIINDTIAPRSSHSPFSLQSTSYAHSPASSLSSLSEYSAPSSRSTDHKRLEPVSESTPSHGQKNSTYASHTSRDFTFPDAPSFETTSAERSRPPSVRLRLESPFDFRRDLSPSPPPKLEPELLERPQREPPPPPHYLKSEPSSLARLRLRDPSPNPPRSPGSSSHHNSYSSFETQIYDPEPTSPPLEQEDQDIISDDKHGPDSSATYKRQYQSPAPILRERQNHSSRPSLELRNGISPISSQDRQHVPTMASPKSSLPPLDSEEDSQERLSSETLRAHVPSPTRDRRQSFIQETQALALPPPIEVRPTKSSLKTQNLPLIPSTGDVQDDFVLETQSSRSPSAATVDQKDVSTMKARSAVPARLQSDQARPSLDMQRLHSPRQSQEHQGRPIFEARQSSFERQPRPLQISIPGRRPSVDSMAMKARQERPSLDVGSLPLEQPIKETQRSRGQSLHSRIAQRHQRAPSSSSQQLSLEQFIQESKDMQERSNASQTFSPPRSPLSAGKPGSRQITVPEDRNHIVSDTSLERDSTPRPDRPSKFSKIFASQHKVSLPAGQGAYDNTLIETHGFPPERPPSPPATPDLGKSLPLTPETEEFQRMKSPPPIPHRSVWRSPSQPRSILRSTRSSIDNGPSDRPKSKTSSSIDAQISSGAATALHSPKLSITTRGSSINAITSAPPVPFLNFSEAMKSPPRLPSSHSIEDEYFNDADLEPLPLEPSVPSVVDYNVLPFENPNAGPAIFRTTQLGRETPISHRREKARTGPAFFRATSHSRSVSHNTSVSSRASSFDSAAPPPIGLTRRITHAIDQSEMPKKDKKPSLLSFLRSTPTPKAILYSEATQGQPPSLPSSPASSSRKRFPGRRSGEPRMRPGLDPRGTAGSRSPAHVAAAEKRKSWVRGDDLDQIRAASRAEKQREFERILNSI